MKKDNLIQPGHARNGLLMARAINHPIRAQIIALLEKNGEMDVTSIYTDSVFRDKKGMYMEQSQCSQHLAILRNANLVKVEKRGKERIYSVHWGVYDQVCNLLQSLSHLYQEGAPRTQPNGAAYSATSLH